MSLLLLFGTTGPTYQLNSDSAALTIAGQDAGLYRHRSLFNDGASIAIDGQSVGFVYGRVLVADTLAIEIAGSAGLARGWTLTAALGDFLIAGQDAALSYGRAIVADSASIEVIGQAILINWSGYKAPGALVIGRMSIDTSRMDRLQTATRQDRQDGTRINRNGASRPARNSNTSR